MGNGNNFGRGYFKLEHRQNTTVLYLGRDGSKTLTLKKNVTRKQVWTALGNLPSGAHNRMALAKKRVAAAGLV